MVLCRKAVEITKRRKIFEEEKRSGKLINNSNNKRSLRSTWLRARVLCSLEIENFFRSLFLTSVHSLNMNIIQKKIFPFVFVCFSMCHLSCICGSELAIYFLILRFMCGLWAFYASVFRLLRLFYVTCQQSWRKETTRTKWMKLVVKQWKFFAILFFFARCGVS